MAWKERREEAAAAAGGREGGRLVRDSLMLQGKFLCTRFSSAAVSHYISERSCLSIQPTSRRRSSKTANTDPSVQVQSVAVRTEDGSKLLFPSLVMNPALADQPSNPVAAASLICVVHTLIVHSRYQLRGVGVAQMQ